MSESWKHYSRSFAALSFLHTLLYDSDRTRWSRTDDSEHDGTNKNTTMPAMGLASKYYTVSLQPSKLVHVLTTSYENKYSCQMARVVMPEEGSLPSELKEDS